MNDEELERWKELVLSNANWLQGAPDIIKKDPNIILEATKKHPWAIKDADSSLFGNKDFIYRASIMNAVALRHATDELKSDHDFIFGLVGGNGLALKHVHDSLKSNKEIGMAAVSQNGDSRGYINTDLRDNIDIILAAGIQSGDGSWPIETAVLGFERKLPQDGFATYTQPLYDAVSIEFPEQRREACGMMYRDIHGLNEGGYDACFEHVLKNNWSLLFMTGKLCDDDELLGQVLSVNGCAIAYASKRIRSSFYSALMAVNQSPSAKQYLPEKLQNDQSISCVASIISPEKRNDEYNAILSRFRAKSAYKVSGDRVEPKIDDVTLESTALVGNKNTFFQDGPPHERVDEPSNMITETPATFSSCMIL